MRKSVAWLILLASAVLEAVWATALGLSAGFREPVPTVVFAVTATLSMLGLGMAIRHISLSTAYAVWVGIGAALTVAWAMATGAEPFSVLKLLFIAGIVGCAAGLKILPAGGEGFEAVAAKQGNQPGISTGMESAHDGTISPPR